jgi:DNA-binding response OmpR family regulator
MSRILIVEDEAAMAAGLKDNLELEGYSVDHAADGGKGLRLLRENSYDLAILDVMLPTLSGFDILKAARQSGVTTPTIMLTARGEEIDRVLGLELGADDYLTKPFSLRELLARVKAVLRRSAGTGPQGGKAVLGRLEVNFATYTATKNGSPVEMTPKEYDILKFLWEHRNQTVSRDALLTNVWGYDEPLSTRTIDNFILRLRQKLEDDPAHPRVILTVHGVGYKLVPGP